MFTVDVIKITGRIYFRLSIQQSCIQKTIKYGSKWIHPGAHPIIFFMINPNFQGNRNLPGIYVYVLLNMVALANPPWI